MKKMLVVVLGLAVTLALVLPVLASDQKVKPELDDVAEAYIKTLEADLAYIDALVKAEQITPEQADYAKKSVQSEIDYITSGDSVVGVNCGASPMMGQGYGMMGGRSMMGYGHGMMMGRSSMPCGY